MPNPDSAIDLTEFRDAIPDTAAFYRLKSTIAAAIQSAKVEAYDEAANEAARLLVLADTTSGADVHIPAAIRRLGGE